MIKSKAEAKSWVTPQDDTTKNKMDIALIKKDIEHIKENTDLHNGKTEKEFASINKKIDRIDTRLWAVAGLIIATTFGKMLSDWMM